MPFKGTRNFGPNTIQKQKDKPPRICGQQNPGPQPETAQDRTQTKFTHQSRVKIKIPEPTRNRRNTTDHSTEANLDNS